VVVFNISCVDVEIDGMTAVSVKCGFIADKEILEVFTSCSELPIQLLADKPLSIIIVGGLCPSRVAVANRLLGSDVLPEPHLNVAWHTLQLVDTNCVNSFKTALSAGEYTVWSWVNSVPLVDIEHNSVQTAWTVVNILMSHALLRARSQVVVCGDVSCIDTVESLLCGVIPVIVFVVSNGELLQNVSISVIIVSDR